MLKYLIIQLDESSTSFCHYNQGSKIGLIPIRDLKQGIFWSMKENLTVQIIYPEYELPLEYKEAIAATYHASIVPSSCTDIHLRNNADVVVFNSLEAIHRFPFVQSQTYVIRISLSELLESSSQIYSLIHKLNRLNIVITDIQSFTNDFSTKYESFLESLSDVIHKEYNNNHGIQINILTDRMLLDGMNNCNAGHESITLAPDGKFYICPAFYLDGNQSVGDLENGLNINNQQLYRIDHAPICRICDAYQCRRCIWLNKKFTLEVNTPSHEQCVMAHIERNASRKLLSKIREIGQFLPDKEINEIDYLDPFDKITH